MSDDEKKLFGDRESSGTTTPAEETREMKDYADPVGNPGEDLSGLISEPQEEPGKKRYNNLEEEFASPRSGEQPGAGENISVPADTDLQTVAPVGPVGEAGEYDLDREKQPTNKNLLELIYGVLFDPVETFRDMAAAPPIGQTLLIFSAVSVLAAVMGFYVSSRMFGGDLYGGAGPLAGIGDVMVPLMVFGGLVLAFVKWIAYSGLLHLVAEMFGGSGRALGVLVVTGLASLPVILLMPFELLVVLVGGEGLLATIVTGLFGLVSLAWGFVLVVLGLREVQGFSTGRALAVALSPPLAMLVLMLIFVLGTIGIFAAMPSVFDNMTY